MSFPHIDFTALDDPQELWNELFRVPADMNTRGFSPLISSLEAEPVPTEIHDESSSDTEVTANTVEEEPEKMKEEKIKIIKVNIKTVAPEVENPSEKKRKRTRRSSYFRVRRHVPTKPYSPAKRRHVIRRFLEKRRRMFARDKSEKIVLYESRSEFAKTRQRIGGKFTIIS